ncbi:DUF488 domain-containing protein [Alkalilimnicola sp. S0819]|uniref:DUF488 domain-containing protein n=1 Tax=Alkalilimnicola sp. S0819 TaxID=2613922 RepID=UPI0012621DEA|nr:DUF488 family protein [Alkalilimnicola sp. S0819]KAB7623367.1 DUF488 family protein [Alkalilimnicola sp. S0819]MPQ16907.1 DUF488 family protein [Alkalilimnicola sp. S0819]
MTVHTQRAYDHGSSSAGHRVLVDRLWPRGVSKAQLKADEWLKDCAPSEQLRKRFHDGEMSWADFRRAYLAELKCHREELRPLADKARRGSVTLLYGSSDPEHNNAVVMAQYLKMLAH